MMSKLLLVTTEKWVSTARLAMAFVECGCEVEVCCRGGHPVLTTKAFSRRYSFNPAGGVKSIEVAMRASRPELIVCCDETALGMMMAVHVRCDAAMREVIERSVGDAKGLETALARSVLMRMAREEGVGTPATADVATVGDVEAQIAAMGLPLVMKADGSAGGRGVRILKNAGDAATYLRRLHGPMGVARTANRVLMEKDWVPMARFLRREKFVVCAQEFISSGREANMAVLSWRGEVLAMVCLEVVECWRVGGPSSVLRVIENEEMKTAARKLLKRMGFTGFCGFDFIFSAEGRPLLLEMNARPTQVCHLALGAGKDLVAAMVGALRGDAVLEREAVAEKGLIALFPQEWQRDARSKYLREAYHDVPWEEPELVKAGINAAQAR